jgi:hypothetical protein
MLDQEKLTKHLHSTFSAIVDLPVAEVFEANITLSEIMARSAGLANSVDLMEAFAKCAKSTRQEFGVRLRLPAMPLSTPINEVMDLLVSQALETSTEGQVNAAE